MSNATMQPTAAETASQSRVAREVYIYSHSNIVYWWPVWVIGYIFALLTYFQGTPVDFVDHKTQTKIEVLVHPSKNLGVIFTFVFLMVILMTHITVRGTASVTVIVSLIAVTLLFAYMDWWEAVLFSLGKLAIYMNLGFYVFFSSSVFLVWALAMFVVDRLEYWVIRPGQMIHHQFMGGGEQSFDTRGMSVTKLRSDMFRHWVLGLGAGDLRIAATGANATEFVIPNVLFVGFKEQAIQQLVAEKPIDNVHSVVTAGTPD